MIESLASSYTHMKQAEVQQAAGMAVLKQSMDTMKAQASGVVELLRSAAPMDPALGNNVDTFA